MSRRTIILRRVRLFHLLVILVLTLALPAIFLRGTVPQKTVLQVDGLSNFSSLQSVTLGELKWAESFTNLTAWTLAGNAPALLQLNNSLTLNAAFPQKSTSQSVTASRTINVPLDHNQIISLTLTVSRGISYGIRLYGQTSNGTSLAAWHEGSSLQHRPGTGLEEAISLNPVTEFLAANPGHVLAGARITKIALYVEAAPLASGNFSMKLTKLNVNSVNVLKASSNELSGTFTTIVADLGPTVQSQGLFQVFIGLDVRGTADLSYVPYFVSGTSVIAQGFTYVSKAVTTYELALLQPSFVRSSPLFTGQSSSSSIVISAVTGAMTFFRLDSVSIRFLSSLRAPSQVLDPSNYRLLLFYYIVFLFVAPTAMVVLVVKVFRDEN